MLEPALRGTVLRGTVLRAVAALGLLVSGYVHLDLAATYNGIGESLTVGDLFRAQGVVALLAAGAVLLVRRRSRPQRRCS